MAASAANRVALYASVGPELTHYDLDVEGATLARRGTVSLPANVHYVWPHASRRFLYVASSDSASGIGGVVGTKHHVTALAIDPASGALAAHGAPITLPTRPIHMTTDIPSQHILVAFSNPSGLSVYRINPDGTPGAEVMQQEGVDPGIYGHQVRVRLDNRKVILVTRGHDAAGGKPEEPGALKVFDYRDGQLTGEESVAPNGGYGFGPRHLDFHPTEPWVYVSLERQNRLDMFAFHDRTLLAAAVFQKGTLGEPGNIRGRQAGRYGARPSERALRLRRQPRLLDNRNRWKAGLHRRREHPRGLCHRPGDRRAQPDPACRHARHPLPHLPHRSERAAAGGGAHHGAAGRDGATIRNVPACLSLFRIAGDGKLDFVRKYDIEIGDRTMWWMGMVAL